VRRARRRCDAQVATRIEVYVGMPGPGGAPAQMKRLGYLSFASNEGSDFKARELKSVHVATPAQLLRLVFHKCHINKLNIYNQVGLPFRSLPRPRRESGSSSLTDFKRAPAV